MFVFDLTGYAAEFVAAFAEIDDSPTSCQECREVAREFQVALSFQHGGVRLRLSRSSKALRHFEMKVRAAGLSVSATEGRFKKAGEELLELCRRLRQFERESGGPLSNQAWDPQTFIPAWVAVEERLPDCDERLSHRGWFYVRRRGGGVSMRYFNAVEESWIRPVLGVKAPAGAREVARDDKVTHWLAFNLPTRPKGAP